MIKCLSVKCLIIHHDPLSLPGLFVRACGSFAGPGILLRGGHSRRRLRQDLGSHVGLGWGPGSTVTGLLWQFHNLSLSFLIYKIRILVALHVALVRIN